MIFSKALATKEWVYHECLKYTRIGSLRVIPIYYLSSHHLGTPNSTIKTQTISGTYMKQLNIHNISTSISYQHVYQSIPKEISHIYSNPKINKFLTPTCIAKKRFNTNINNIQKP